MRRRFSKETIPVFFSVLLGLRAIGTLICIIWPQFFEYICFNPELILEGQVWRLVSFVLFPSGGQVYDLFWLAIITFFEFTIAETLVMVIGKKRLNYFLITGLVTEVILGFVYYYLMLSLPGMGFINALFVCWLHPNYLYSMLFVLFAMLFPNAQFLIMFVIPVKGKWLTFITLGMFLIEVVSAFLRNDEFSSGYGWILVVMIASAVIATVFFILFFRKTAVKQKGFTGTAKKMRQKSRSGNETAGGKRETSGKSIHRCAVCGRTEKTNPELEFRYCSKCVGNYEYCNEHLYTHLHKYPKVTDF